MHWEMGQMLLPHHLIAEQQASHRLLGCAIDQIGVPFYGFSAVDWEWKLLEQGVLHVESLTARFPSGEWVDLPQNASLEKNLDLNGESKNQVSVYLHLLKEKKQVEEMVTVKEYSTPVCFSYHHLTLSPEKEVDGSISLLKLAEFKKMPDNRWVVEEEYIPPLLNTSCSLFLGKKFLRMRNILDNVEKRINHELQAPHFFAQQKQEAVLCLLEIDRLKRFFLNLPKQITPHPYVLYEHLCRLLDVVKREHAYPPLPYQHDALGPLLMSLTYHMEKMLIEEYKGFNCLQFERKEGVYFLDSLSPTLLQAQEIYFVVQKADTQQAFALKGSKLSSKSRMVQIKKFALAGIPLLPIKTPSFFNAGFSVESEVYTVDKENEEWKLALEENSLTFFNQDFPPSLQIFLYWRGGTE